MDASMLAAIRQLNEKSASEGKQAYEAFQEITKAPMTHQQSFLFKLLADNKDTEYGKKYGFAEITNIKEFQEKLPVTSYDDYAPYIARMSEQGETNLITAYPVSHYNKSSGTVGKPKRIPTSDIGTKIFFHYAGTYLNGLITTQLGNEWTNGRNLSSVDSVEEIERVPSGASYGALSANSMFSLRRYLPIIFTSPDEAVFPQKNTFSRYLHARFGLMDEGVTRISASFSSLSYELMRYIENNWEILVEDIAKGTIHERIAIGENARQTLMEKIKPMPERAAALKAIFEKGFDEPFIPKVWPNMVYTFAVGTGVFQSNMFNMKKRYIGDTIPHYYAGLHSSEGVSTVPFALDNMESTLIPDSLFFEFLSVEEGDDFSKLITMDQLEKGKIYEVFATNLSGFYRYRTRDAIRVVGMHHATPTVEYLYRLDNTVSLVGEKTSEAAIRFAAEETAKELGFELVGFSMYPDDQATPARYQYFLEIARMPSDINPKVIRLCIEKNLAKANPSMGDKVKKGICGATRVNILEPESYSLYMELMVFKGVSASQLKPVIVIRNEEQRKFFFGQTEYSSELMR